jgi:hypothetical protein
MFKRLKNLFKKPAASKDQELEAMQAWDSHKSKLMEEILGREHNMVMHAIIPYMIGGGLDLYYFPNGIPGTGIATKELSTLPNHGSANKEWSCYELVMFTRHHLNLDEAKNKETPFGKAHFNINGILNCIARYSETTPLNPNETCEFPPDMKSLGGKCVIFDDYGSRSDDVVRRFGMLLIVEVFRSEMNFARSNGTAELIARLKAAGHYPYSDLAREPVA